jgi:hypothetical protein
LLWKGKRRDKVLDKFIDFKIKQMRHRIENYQWQQQEEWRSRGVAAAWRQQRRYGSNNENDNDIYQTFRGWLHLQEQADRQGPAAAMKRHTPNWQQRDLLWYSTFALSWVD